MTAFVSVSTDAFAERRKDTQSKQPQVNVRRPLRGIQVKEDTYSVLRVLTATGADIPLLDSSSPTVDAGNIGRSSYYSNYIIQSVSEQRAEKQQIIETFGEDYVYFFGERPRFLDVRGVLLNTSDFNWKSEFWENYERSLRGTRLVEQNARAYLYFDDVVVEGYFMAASADLQSSNPHMLPFQFQMFVAHYSVLSTVGSVLFKGADRGKEAKSVYPDTMDRNRRANQPGGGAAGGLGGFLASATQAYDNATFAVQGALEAVRNTFYGRRIAVPDGLGSQIVAPDIGSRQSLPAAATGQPIHKMFDEYVERTPPEAKYDKLELLRVEKELLLSSPEALDKKARLELAKRGVDVSKPNAATLLLGRGAFAAIQYVAPFGLRRVGGELGIADQAARAAIL